VATFEMVDSPESRDCETNSSASFASPKSSTFTRPSRRTMTFSGLMSRWMMPAACAAASAETVWAAMSSSAGGARPSRLTSSRSVLPSTHSMTMKCVAPALTIS
jgi:hypothetical protein